MAHKTLINGTAYAVKDGKTLIDGTAYGIKEGRTRVGATDVTIPFTVPPYTITTEHSSSDSRYTKSATITYNGTTYTIGPKSAPTIEVTPGDSLTVFAVAGQSSYRSNTSVYLGNNVVARGSSSAVASYVYTPTGNAKIYGICAQKGSAATAYCSNVRIIES